MIPTRSVLQAAEQALLDRLRHEGYDIIQGAESDAYLDLRGANALTFLNKDLWLRADCLRIEVLEEYLHNVQHRIGLTNRYSISQLEVHVKQFMVRHRRLLGLGEADVAWLEASLERYR